MNELIEKFAPPKADHRPLINRFRIEKQEPPTKLTRRRLIDPDDDVTPEQIADAAVEPIPDFAPNYDGALAHAEAAQHALKLAKRAANDDDPATSAHMIGHAAAHFLHAHDAIRAAHYTRDGNYLGANRSSCDCAKALCLAKDSFDSNDVNDGRTAIHLASQQLGVVAAALARARLADPSAEIYRHFTLRKCVIEEGVPLCKMAGHG